MQTVAGIKDSIEFRSEKEEAKAIRCGANGSEI